MNNYEDVENMTVATLKRELKAKNLSTVGNKGELAQRLTEFLVNEEHKLLQASSVGSDDLLDLPDEIVLGLDTTIDGVLSKSSNESLLVPGEETCQKSSTVVPFVNQVSSSADCITSENISTSTLNNATEKSQEHNNQLQAKKNVIEAPLTEDQKKKLRAKKFNTPVIHTKEMRAERFGIVSAKETTKKDEKSSELLPTVANIEKLKNRAERFGLPSSKSESSTSDKLSGHKKISVPPGDEKLKQRALRFGVDSSKINSKVSLSTINASSLVDTDKKMSDSLLKRKQRFGDMLKDKDNASSPEAKKVTRAHRFGAKV